MKFATSLLIISNLTFAAAISGNFKTYPIIKDIPTLTHTRLSLQNSSKFQLGLDLPLNAKFEMAYELTAITEKQLVHSEPTPAYRVLDFNIYLHNEKPSYVYTTTISQNLNRFNYNISLPMGDLSIGRMPITFGVSKSISPNDVLTPIAINSIDKEERTGIDGLVFKTQINQDILLDTGIIVGHEYQSAKNAYYLRPKLTIDKLDLTLNLMKFRNKNLIGLEIQHPIKDAGFWSDISFFDNYLLGKKDFIRLTTGLDYKFQNTLYGAIEYHYNGSSSNSLTAYSEDFIFLRNKHYFILTTSYELTPLLIATLQTFENLHDHSNFCTLKLDYNLSDNSYLTLGTYQGIGNKLSSEFGRYGKIYFSSFRYYF